MAKDKAQFNQTLQKIASGKISGELGLSFEELTDQDVKTLSKALAQNTTLTSLNLYQNKIGDKGATALAQNTTLTSLYLALSQIGDKGATALAQNTTLTSLDLGSNQIGAKGAKALAQNTTLTSLDLMYNQISTEGAKALAKNATLTSLYLAGNNIGDEGETALAQNTTLTSLDLTLSQIGDKGAKALAQNTTLTSLNLEDNQIGAKGAKALAQNTTLTSLDLRLNKIGDKGATALAQNTTLTSLDLGSNQIGAKGAKALAQNTTLTSLNLRYNQISAEGATALAQNTTLTFLDLKHNEIGDTGAKALAQNTTLTSLDLDDNEIGAEGAKALALNTTLTSLNLYGNEIGAEVNKAVKTTLARNQAQANGFLQACQSGQLRDLQPLLAQHRASPYLIERSYRYFDLKKTDSLNTGLHLAIISQQPAVVEWLSTQYPQLLKMENQEKQTPVQLAKHLGYQDMLALLQRHSAGDPGSSPGWCIPKKVPQSSSVRQVPEKARQSSPVRQVPRKVAAAEAAPKPLPATQGGSYLIPSTDIKLGKKLGEGAFGVVFQGTYQLAPAAIKQLILTQLTPKALKEFQQEGEVMSQLRHPHIISFYGVTQEHPYQIVMEYMPNGSLFHVLHSDSDLSWAQRTTWGAEIGSGLHYLHGKQILHRDLKSLNVLVGARNETKLTDFGLALANLRSTTKTITAGKSQKGKSEQAVGSLRWMAPELFSLKPKYAIASDVYAYGMILWELSSREVPYSNVFADSIIQTAVAGGDREEIPDDCPPKLAQLITACWAQAPKDRPSVDRIVTDLNAQGQAAQQSGGASGSSSQAAQVAQSRGYGAVGTNVPASGDNAASANSSGRYNLMS